MTTKGKVLIVCSNSDTLELKNGGKEPTGFYLNELAVPAQALVDAGYEIVLATPKGMAPVVDRFSIAANYFGGSDAALQNALQFVATNPGIQNPRSIRSVIDEGLDNYVGVFLPGDHPPMIDLMQDSDLGEVLRYFNAKGKPTAFLCHGPIAMTAAMPKAKEFRQAMVQGDIEAAKAAAAGWQYEGYRITAFTNDEEKWAEQNILKGGEVLFYPSDALRAAGGRVQAKGLFEPNVMQDRELITGQNPFSDHLFADLLVSALDRFAELRAA